MGVYLITKSYRINKQSPGGRLLRACPLRKQNEKTICWTKAQWKQQPTGGPNALNATPSTLVSTEQGEQTLSEHGQLSSHGPDTSNASSSLATAPDLVTPKPNLAGMEGAGSCAVGKVYLLPTSREG